MVGPSNRREDGIYNWNKSSTTGAHTGKDIVMPHAMHVQPTLYGIAMVSGITKKAKTRGWHHHLSSVSLEAIEKDEGQKKKLTFTECITMVRSYAMCFKYINL